jgi:hypothetical protein
MARSTGFARLLAERFPVRVRADKTHEIRDLVRAQIFGLLGIVFEQAQCAVAEIPPGPAATQFEEAKAVKIGHHEIADKIDQPGAFWKSPPLIGLHAHASGSDNRIAMQIAQI